MVKDEMSVGQLKVDPELKGKLTAMNTTLPFIKYTL